MKKQRAKMGWVVWWKEEEIQKKNFLLLQLHNIPPNNPNVHRNTTQQIPVASRNRTYETETEY